MEKRQLTTILYLIASMLMLLAAVLNKNPLLAPMGVLLLILGGFHSQDEEEKSENA